METITQHKRDERIDKLKSATLTALISALLFLLIFYYQFVREIPKEEKVTTMLINFGDNRNGIGAEEPANQEGSLASADIYIPEELKTPEPQPQEIVETPKAVEKPAEKIITGKSEKTTAVKTEKTEKKSTKSSETTAFKTTASKTSSTSNTTTKKAQGDGKGTAAIGNLSKEEELKLERKELMEPKEILAILLVEKEMVTAKLVLTESLFLTFLEPWEKVANSPLITVQQTEPLPFLIR